MTLLNPSQPPLNRGGASLSLLLLEEGSQQSCGVPTGIPLAGARGSWRGVGSVMIYEQLNSYTNFVSKGEVLPHTPLPASGARGHVSLKVREVVWVVCARLTPPRKPA